MARSGKSMTATEMAAAAAGGLALAYPAYLALMFRSHDWILTANGRPVITDFLVFWLAGRSALQGAAAAAYDPHILHAAEAAAAGHAFAGQLPWRYSPIFLFAVAALALLPYLMAFLVWIGGTLAAFSIAISRIAGARLALVLACATPAVFINAICGQNGPLTAALIGGALLTLEERPVLSGFFLAFLTYKPQLGILFPFVLVIGGYWRTLISATVTTAALILASWAAFGAAALVAFVHFLPITTNTLLVHGANGFNKLQTVYGLVRSLGYGNGAGWAAQTVVILVPAGLLLWLWRREVPFALKAAALAVATLLVTPHLYAYDFAVLAVSFAFLYRHHPFDLLDMAGIALANLCIGLFLFFPSPIGLASVAIAGALIARRVVHAMQHSTPCEFAGEYLLLQHPLT